MSVSGNTNESLNHNSLFPLHLYQAREVGEQRELDENYHDQALPAGQTKLEKAKQTLKIGTDTNFDTPIEEFGAKILTNLGWKEGFGLGRDSDKPCAPIEYIPRQHRLGLGAKALTLEQATSRRQKTVTENYEASEIGKNYKRVGDELKTKKEIRVGCRVEVLSGPHEGLTGDVIAMKKQSALGHENTGDQYVSVQLCKSGANVEIKMKRLRLKTIETRAGSRSRSPVSPSHQRQSQTMDENKRRPLRWVKEGILVRCVSRSACDGRLYGKELVICTVLSEFAFEAKCDGKLYSDLKEKHLETVLPTTKQIERGHNTDVLLLRGKYKGKLGKVLTIDKRRDVVEVQIEYVDVTRVSQDDVCSLA